MVCLNTESSIGSDLMQPTTKLGHFLRKPVLAYLNNFSSEIIFVSISIQFWQFHFRFRFRFRFGNNFRFRFRFR
jgi:hypothetical protein